MIKYQYATSSISSCRSAELPANDPYLGYYGPDFSLIVEHDPAEPNANHDAYLNDVKRQVIEHLRNIPAHTPSVQRQGTVRCKGSISSGHGTGKHLR
jgi:hypothetical protein